MKQKHIRALVASLFAFFGLATIASAAPPEPTPVGRNGMFTGTSYQNDVSLPLYYLPARPVDDDDMDADKDTPFHEGPKNPPIVTNHVDSVDPVVQHTMAPQPLIPVASPAVAAALADPERTATVPLIEDEQSLFGWDAWFAADGPAELAGHPRRRFPDASLAVEAALAGHGVWLAWPLLVDDALDSGRLVRAFPDSIDAGLGYWMVSTPARWRRPEVARFRGWITSTLGGDGA